MDRNMSHANDKNRRCLTRWIVALMLGVVCLSGGCATGGPFKKAPAVVAPKPRTVQPKYQEKQGLFAPKDEKPQTVVDWMGKTSQSNLQ
jgi:hypothetical protein